MKHKEEKKQQRQLKKQMKKQKRKQKRETIKRLPTSKKVRHYLTLSLICLGAILFLLASIGTVAHATGLVDDTLNPDNAYSTYALEHYQLDFYVDNSWAWLPWNWSDGLGKSVMYGLYAITNFIWTISLYLANATGYLVQEAYGLDFISETADAIGKNIQTLAGVTKNGFSSSGFYVGFLLIFILILGLYVTYTGLIKRETTKAIQAIINFVVVFLLSASFIAYAPDYVGKLNDFSKDVSQASLDIGTQLVLPHSDTQGKDSVALIRDSLFAIQVKQPWLLLQYGATDVDETRVEKLLGVSPDTNNGEDREKVVIDEIEKQDNANLSLSKVIARLGTVFFLFLFNIGISIFVFLLTGIMIFSQVLFIIFAMFLPISFLLSMIPSFEGMGKRAVTKLFNVMMTRAGITLVITVAFSISSMVYSLAGTSPFFMVMFLQIVTFAGIYFKLGDILSMFSLQSNDSQSMGRQLFRRPRQLISRQSRRFQRSMSRALSSGQHTKTNTFKKEHTPTANKANHARNNQTENRTNHNQSNKPTHPNESTNRKRNLGTKTGETVGTVLDTKNRMQDKASQIKDRLKDAPTNAKYALYQGKRGLVDNVQDFSSAMRETRTQKQQTREKARQSRRQTVAQRRLEMEQARQRKTPLEPMASMEKRTQQKHERKQPVTTKVPTTTHKRATVPAKAPVNPTMPVLPEITRPAIRQLNQVATPPEPSQRPTTLPKTNEKSMNPKHHSSSQSRTTTVSTKTVKKSTTKTRKHKP